MYRDKIFFLLFLVVSQLATFAAAELNQKWLVDFDRCEGFVEFKAIGRPSALQIHGKGEKPKGKLYIDGGTFSGSSTFSLDSLDTGINLRNEHMKSKYLETGKYSEAKLTFIKVIVLDLLKSEVMTPQKITFEGKLLLHGIEKVISGTVEIEKKKSEIFITAEFSIKISDFEIDIPSFAGITMAEDVELRVQVNGPLAKI